MVRAHKSRSDELRRMGAQRHLRRYCGGRRRTGQRPCVCGTRAGGGYARNRRSASRSAARRAGRGQRRTRWAHTRLRVVDGSTHRTRRARMWRVWYLLLVHNRSATLSWTLFASLRYTLQSCTFGLPLLFPRGSSYKRRDEHVSGNSSWNISVPSFKSSLRRRFGGQPASCRPSRRGPPKVLRGVALRYSTPMFGAGSLEPAAPAMPCSASACGTHSTASRRAASEAPGPLSPSSRRRTAPRLWAQNVTALTSLLVLLSTPLSAAEVASTPAEGGRRLRYAPLLARAPRKRRTLASPSYLRVNRRHRRHVYMPPCPRPACKRCPSFAELHAAGVMAPWLATLPLLCTQSGCARRPTSSSRRHPYPYP